MGTQNGTAMCESSLAVPQKVNHRVTIWLATPFLHVPKRNKNILPCKNMDKNIHSSIVNTGKKWKEHKWPPAGEQIRRAWSHPVECYWTITKNELLAHVIIWVSPENITLSEGSHQRPSTGCFHLNGISRIRKSIETESRRAFPCSLWRKEIWGGGVGNGGWLPVGLGFFPWVLKSFCGWLRGWFYNPVDTLKNCTL